MAIAAVHGWLTELCARPHGSIVVGGFVVTLDTSVKRGAARVLDGDNIALGVIVCALCPLIDASAMNGGEASHQSGIKTLDLQYAVHFSEALDELVEVVGIIDEHHNLALKEPIV